MNMKLFRALALILIFGGAGLPVSAQNDAYLIKTSDGREIIVDGDKPEITSGSVILKKIDHAEGYIFSNQGGRQKKFAPAQTVFTGVYSSRKSAKESISPNEADFTETSADSNLEDVGVSTARAANDATIAWVTREADFYHDPFLECASHSTRLWVKDVAALAGLEPCKNCFHSTGHAPGFINNESKGLDLASAGALLDNDAFLKWLEQHLPVKNAVFLTGQKMLIYPKQEMSSEALRELAHEVALAYRRHTWKVIEVLGKKSESDLENISSY